MAKLTKTELTKFRRLLESQLASLRGDVGSMKDEALRASDQDSSVDHLADQGTDNYDQGFLLGLIENEEETIEMIEEALERIEGRGEWPFGACPMCMEEVEGSKPDSAEDDAKPAPKAVGSKSAGTKSSSSKSGSSKVGAAKAASTKSAAAKTAAKSAAKAAKPAAAKAQKIDYWIPTDRLEYVPWARYCVRHQEEAERRASA